MIAVIADDLTGAAELGGIGLAYGLEVELSMSVNLQSKADLLVISTDARSVSEPEAVREMTEVSRALQELKPLLIYKKIDSVLRGHILAETRAQLTVLGLAKALLVPANPALGRTLVHGCYYVDGKPLHQTHFAHDPEFPVTDSDVLKRFKITTEPVFVRNPSDALPNRGVVFGNVEKWTDLQAWVERIDHQTLPGGGSGFFTAILDSRFLPKRETATPVALGNARLYVCGSAFKESVDWVKKAVHSGHFVQYMPKALLQPGTLDESSRTTWATEVATSLQQRKPVVMAIDPAWVENSSAVQLRTDLAKTVRDVLNRTHIDELIIEGGSTASAVLREIGITRLAPVQELATGVVRSKAIEIPQLHVTVKPGSYRWPPELGSF
ncbi:four-carbon acid sugar kinase family protein [Larkinella sp. GY13]|uniref:four-carbon acid sugar kinase family protein n=1 Tax=Larkinella sp. GY13 TaxID=3453720 RepID=UPI003EE90713